MLKTPLTKSLLHTTDKYINAFAKGWVTTVSDLLFHYPRDYEDRTNVLEEFSLLNIKEKNTILVKLINVSSQRTRNNKILTKAVIEDKHWILSEAVWFNRKYLQNQLVVREWTQVLLSWKVKYEYWKLSFMSPELETDLEKVQGEIVPLYPDLNYIPWKWIHKKMELLKKYVAWIKEVLPQEIIDKYKFIERKTAFYKLHFPKNNTDVQIARRRLAYEELFLIQYDAIKRKNERISESKDKSIPIPLNADFVKELIKSLPFELTNVQKISLFQILKDMEKTTAMMRLFEWDVWTGKTIVAMIAVIHALKESEKLWNRIQVSLMAPTEILARQHFEWIQEILMNNMISSHLLVGSTTWSQKTLIKKDLKNWNVDIVVGTHALIQEDVKFKNLWFVIIDEQHRFWVKQRAMLEENINSHWKFPHVLNMTATPIPRTLALTLYWDQDLSILNEYPKDRKLIHTKVIRTNAQREQVNLFIEDQVRKGRQVFWISPLVEESEKIDLANAVKTYDSLTEIFNMCKVWLVHWRLKPKVKENVMREFSNNEIQVLSSTSVVEVGIDVPNATVMCIEWAERFWLSQLHQFRWRVGRWKYQSYCYLFPTEWQYTDRLKAMERTNNGFELSEIDLNIRWPWEVYWVRQSWIPDLKIADVKDLALVSQIREDIEKMMWWKKSE